MSNFVTTLIFASLLGAFAATLMSLGWLIGGQEKILKPRCGKRPDEKGSNCCMGKDERCKKM